MNRLLLLLAFFHFRADDPKDPSADDPADDLQPELDLDPADPDADPQDDPQIADKAEVEAARREAKEHKEAAERYQRELADLRSQRQARPSDDIVAQEDAKLKDPATTPLEKWQIESNRALRAGTTAAQMALAQAEDVRDQTSFSRLAVTEPAMHKRYAAKVEQELAKARSQGWNPKREVIYNQLMAQDMREGKFKKKAAPAADVDQTKNKAARGKLPGVRSDVGARGGSMTEHEKRAKRLENTQI